MYTNTAQPQDLVFVSWSSLPSYPELFLLARHVHLAFLRVVQLLTLNCVFQRGTEGAGERCAQPRCAVGSWKQALAFQEDARRYEGA